MATPTATKPIMSRGLFDAAAYYKNDPNLAAFHKANPQAGDALGHWEKYGQKEPWRQFTSIAPAQVDDSVANKVQQITSKDSPLMQMARTEGLKTVNSRGLLNSSMAAGASQDAMLRAAVPIASQEASQDFQRNANARQFEYSMALGDRDAELQERIARMNLNSSDRNAAAQSLANWEGMYQEQYRSIMANTALSAQQRSDQLTAAKNMRDRMLNFTEQLWDIDLNW